MVGVYMALTAASRAVWLLRPDAYGHPFVNRFEWYFFHAVAFDMQQAAIIALPGVLIVILAAVTGDSGPKIRGAGLVLTRVLLALVLFFAAVDQELMRYMGLHLSPRYLATYMTADGLASVGGMLEADRGGQYIGLALIFITPAVFLWLCRRRAFVGRASSTPRRAVVLFVASWAVCWLFTEEIWGGTFREKRVATPWMLAVEAWQEEGTAAVTPQLEARAQAAHHARWRRMNEAADTPAHARQYFDRAARPLHHRSIRAICSERAANLPDGVTCGDDNDRDGHPVARDCNDADPNVHPAATDIALNGIDENCDGRDAGDWNVLLLIMESHRGMNVGHLGLIPGKPSSTPYLDKLAAGGVSFKRATSNGLPTIASFMTIHTGLLPRAPGSVAIDHADQLVESLPSRLRAAGYYTRFFTAAEPAWDNQSPWLARWYDAVDYHRSRIEDAPLFHHLGEWMRDNVPKLRRKDGSRRPFFICVMTRTNHFPFKRVDGVGTTGPDTMAARMHDTMIYADNAMERFVRAIGTQPWMKRTLVIVTGDHGFPLGEHGHTRLYNGANIESVGVPIVLAGPHPRIRALHGNVTEPIASHIDIVPTVLDLLGMPTDGPWMGRSLVGPGKGEAVVITGRFASVERGDLRLLRRRYDVQDKPRQYLYNKAIDPIEKTELDQTTHAAAVKRMQQELQDIRPWMRAIYSGGRAVKPK